MLQEIYFRLVLAGIKTLDEVPEEYREQVKNRVDKIHSIFNKQENKDKKEEE